MGLNLEWLKVLARQEMNDEIILIRSKDEIDNLKKEIMEIFTDGTTTYNAFGNDTKIISTEFQSIKIFGRTFHLRETKNGEPPTGLFFNYDLLTEEDKQKLFAK